MMSCYKLVSKRQPNCILCIGIFCCLIALLSFLNLEKTRNQQSFVNIPSFIKSSEVELHSNHTLHSSKLVLWSSDFHISPIADIKYLLKSYNVEIIDKSLSGHCHLSQTCETDLKVINKANGINLSPCPNQLRSEFFNAYKSDMQFASVDAVLCNHAAGMCELFMAFDKPLIVIASTRYEIGRHDAASWRRWNDNLMRIASSPFNTIAANNKYDLEYMRYFTGIQNIELLPNFCNYVNATHSRSPLRSQVLLAPSRGINAVVRDQLLESLAAFNSREPRANGEIETSRLRSVTRPPLEITPIKELYPEHFEYADLAAHPAVVLLPYQVSVMSLFEFYRMEIPIFVPSPALLTHWHLTYRVLNERTWGSVFGQPASGSVLGRHPNSTSSLRLDPNDEFSAEAVRQWVQLSDFYVWPHITQFDSLDHLFSLLSGTESGRGGLDNATHLDLAYLSGVSDRMRAFNLEEESRIRAGWVKILDKVRRKKQLLAAEKGSRAVDEDVSSALKRLYGVQLLSDCNGQVGVL